MFNVVPPEGVVAPDKYVSITVAFSTQQEIHFNNSADI